MGNQAKVTSTDAIEQFRASLIIFRGKAHRSLDDSVDEVRRTRLWLQHDQRMHWEGEFRKRSRVLAQAEQELMSARLSGGASHGTALGVRQANVNKAKHALEEAEAKLRNVKGWNQNFESCADPIVKRLENIGHYLDNDMPKAISYLVNVLRALSAYASAPPVEGASGSPDSPPGGGSPAESTEGGEASKPE